MIRQQVVHDCDGRYTLPWSAKYVIWLKVKFYVTSYVFEFL